MRAQELYKASPEDASESMGRGKRLTATRKMTRREMGVAANAMYQPAWGPQAVVEVTAPESYWERTEPEKVRQGPSVQPD